MIVGAVIMATTYAITRDVKATLAVGVAHGIAHTVVGEKHQESGVKVELPPIAAPSQWKPHIGLHRSSMRYSN